MISNNPDFLSLQDEFDNLPMYSIRDNWFYSKIAGKDLNEIKKLIIENGEVAPGSQYELIKVLIGLSKIDHIQELLSHTYFDINCLIRDSIFMNIAVSNYAIASVKFLISIGADVTADNNLAIKLAASLSYYDIVKILIKTCADISVDNNFPLCIAVYNGWIKNTKLLIKSGASVFARNNLPLKLAANDGEIELVEFMLKYGADPNCGALSYAICQSHSDIVKLLLKNGALIDMLTIKDYVNAIKSGFPDLIDILIQYGADFSIVNNYDPNDAYPNTIFFDRTLNLLLNEGVDMKIVARIVFDSEYEKIDY